MGGHTPGPWRVGADREQWKWRNVLGGEQPADFSVAAVPKNLPLRSLEEGEANARLIAAAPDLLAACKTIIQAYENADVAPDALDAAYAAVKKAEGNRE